MILKTHFNGKKLKHQNSTNCFIWKQNLYELSFNLAKNSNIRSSLSWIFKQKLWPPFQSFLYWEISITKTYLIIIQFLLWEHTLWSSHCCFSKTFLTLNHTEIFVDLFFLLLCFASCLDGMANWYPNPIEIHQGVLDFKIPVRNVNFSSYF